MICAIELTDYEIDWLARIGEVWKINDNGASSEKNDNEEDHYAVETVAATLAANEAMRLVQGYNSSKARHIGIWHSSTRYTMLNSESSIETQLEILQKIIEGK
jgi:hypothetical protein